MEETRAMIGWTSRGLVRAAVGYSWRPPFKSPARQVRRMVGTVSQVQRKRLNRDWCGEEDKRRRWEGVKEAVVKQATAVKKATPRDWMREGISLFTGAFLCALGSLGGMMSPFGVAAVAAALAVTPQLCMDVTIAAACAAIGAAFGALVAGAQGQALACLLLYGLWMGARLIGWKPGVRLLCAGAGLCAFAAQWIAGPRTMFDLLIALLSASASMALTPVLYTALSVRPRTRQLLSSEEVISLALAVMLLIGGIQQVSVGAFYPVLLAACLLVMVCALTGGVAVGAAGGVLLGLCLSLGESGLSGMVITLGCAGLLAGAFRQLTRAGCAAAFAIGALIATAVGGAPLSLPLFAHIGVAGVALLCLPKKWLEHLNVRVDKTRNIAAHYQARGNEECRRADTRLGQVQTLFSELAQALTSPDADENATGPMMVRQYHAVAQQLKGLREELGQPEPVDPERTRVLLEALDRAALRASEAAVYRGRDGLRIRINIRSSQVRGDALRRLSEIATRCAGRRMQQVGECVAVDGACALLYEEATLYDALTGISCRPRREGPCGDSHVFCELPGGRFMMALADGMGSGRAAARESDEALTLLEKFLCAQVEPVHAISMINDMLMLRGGEEMYTTLDLCLMDLRQGVADFYKIGAANSYIRRGGEVLTIISGALPMGILGGVRPTHQRVELFDGDAVVMVSDGVADASREEGWMGDQLRRIDPRNPQSTADMLEAAARFEAGQTDDRTVLCARIFKRG